MGHLAVLSLSFLNCEMGLMPNTLCSLGAQQMLMPFPLLKPRFQLHRSLLTLNAFLSSLVLKKSNTEIFIRRDSVNFSFVINSEP